MHKTDFLLTITNYYYRELMNFLQYKQKISCYINDFLNESSKKCLVVYTKNSRNLSNILKNIETSYTFTDTYYNVNNSLQLLFLLRQQKNPSKRAAEFNFFINKDFIRFSPINLFRSATNIFRQDLKYFEDQIILQIKEFHSSLAIPICWHEGMDNSICELIENLCTHESADVKFIIIFEDKNLTQIELLTQKDFSEYLEIDFNTSILKTHFDKLSCSQIDALKIATNDDLFEMEGIYTYIMNSRALDSDTDFVINELIKSLVEQNFKGDKSRVLGVAAYFKDKFTIDGIEYICNTDTANRIDTEIKKILDDSIQDGILSVSDEEYIFIIGMFKDALRQIYKAQKNKFHLGIENYLKSKNPFQYDIRYYHLKETQSESAKDMLLMKVINALRFKKDIDIHTKNLFIENYDLRLFENIVDIYSMIDKGNFSAARQKATSINISNNLILHSEIKYLLLFLEWKVMKKQNIKRLESSFNEIYNLDCEIETKLFTKLLQLSIACNNGNKLTDFPTPSQIFLEIIKLLSKYNCVDALYLKNILYRKSNAALNRVSSLDNVVDSFKFFEDKKELYPNEYFMSGVNLVALLLQSTIKRSNESILNSEDRNPYILAKKLRAQLSKDCPIALSVYLENNYLIAKQLFTSNPPTEKELQKVIKQLDKADDGCKIMTLMNIGTLYAMRQNFVYAIKYWDRAEKINEGNDEYFSYIIKSNKLIMMLSQNQHVTTKDCICGEIPYVFSDNEVVQYIEMRQNIINELNKLFDLNYDKIKKYFKQKYRDMFLGMELQFFSQPYILSDVQFWSDN